MSWMPDKDPVLGDKRSCDALDLIIVPRVRDLGDGFSVRRALPHGRRQMVGPFIFFDQMGPVQFVAGQGLDVRPHPHIGLATVTYLFDGRITHRDSEGECFDGPRLLIFLPGDRITVRATRPARLMFLGGAALEGPRYIWWNFVSSRRERIEQAKEDWKTGKFTPVPGETEFIPLPEA